MLLCLCSLLYTTYVIHAVKQSRLGDGVSYVIIYVYDQHIYTYLIYISQHFPDWDGGRARRIQAYVYNINTRTHTCITPQHTHIHIIHNPYQNIMMLTQWWWVWRIIQYTLSHTHTYAQSHATYDNNHVRTYHTFRTPELTSGMVDVRIMFGCVMLVYMCVCQHNAH